MHNTLQSAQQYTAPGAQLQTLVYFCVLEKKNKINSAALGVRNQCCLKSTCSFIHHSCHTHTHTHTKARSFISLRMICAVASPDELFVLREVDPYLKSPRNHTHAHTHRYDAPFCQVTVNFLSTTSLSFQKFFPSWLIR